MRRCCSRWRGGAIAVRCTPERPWLRPAVYSLALAVYCSSWTFYGAVGSAVRNGAGYLPIYLGPLLMLLFGWRIVERLALIARSENTVSIADFISSRYGRSRRLAALVAVIALVGVVPYLALQYKAVAMSLQVLSGQSSAGAPFYADPALYVALGMALFATLFGTRQVDATEHHHGMMLAIALESVVKLLAMVAVGVFAYVWLSARDGGQVLASTRTLFQNTPPVGFISQTLLSFLALVCLPRQFHVAVVECSDIGDIRKARWLFGLYLVLISAMVVPIAAAGIALFGGGDVADDSIVLALPLAESRTALALVAYVGGFSAATGMVIVSSIALATMISNDLVMPVLLRRRGHQAAGADVASKVLWIRRLADPAAGADRLWLLPQQQQRHHAGLVRADGLRRGGAVRARGDRRAVLARRTAARAWRPAWCWASPPGSTRCCCRR